MQKNSFFFQISELYDKLLMTLWNIHVQVNYMAYLKQFVIFKKMDGLSSYCNQALIGSWHHKTLEKSNSFCHFGSSCKKHNQICLFASISSSQFLEILIFVNLYDRSL